MDRVRWLTLTEGAADQRSRPEHTAIVDAMERRESKAAERQLRSQSGRHPQRAWVAHTADGPWAGYFETSA